MQNGSGRDTWEVQLRRGALELAILSALAAGRLYGIEIIKVLKERSALEVAEGTIYPILNRLRTDGFVEAEWVESESGHPRKYYWLTREGRARAKTMADVWNRFVRNLAALVDPLIAGSEQKK